METLVTCVWREHKIYVGKPNQDVGQFRIFEANVTAFIPLIAMFADGAASLWSVTNLFPAKILKGKKF